METVGWLWLQARRGQQGEHSAVEIAARLMDQRHPEHAQNWIPVHPVHPVRPATSTTPRLSAGSAIIQVPTALSGGGGAAPVDSGGDGSGGSAAWSAVGEGITAGKKSCRGSVPSTAAGTDDTAANSDANSDADATVPDGCGTSAVLFPELSVELMRARMRGLQAAADESHARLAAADLPPRHSGGDSVNLAGASTAPAALPSWAAPVEDLTELPDQEDCARDLDCLRSSSTEATAKESRTAAAAEVARGLAVFSQPLPK